MLVGVDDRAVLGPQLDADERSTEHRGLHPFVEPLDGIRVVRQQAVVGVGLDDAFGDVERGLFGVVDGLLRCRHDDWRMR